MRSFGGMTEYMACGATVSMKDIGEITKKSVVFCNKMSKGTCKMRKI